MKILSSCGPSGTTIDAEAQHFALGANFALHLTVHKEAITAAGHQACHSALLMSPDGRVDSILHALSKSDT